MKDQPYQLEFIITSGEGGIMEPIGLEGWLTLVGLGSWIENSLGLSLFVSKYSEERLNLEDIPRGLGLVSFGTISSQLLR
jgi:hypothetical protein